MVKIIVGSLFMALSFGVIANENDELDGLTCLGKKAAIEQKIADAQLANNKYQLDGLEKALYSVKAYCSNSKLEKKYLENGEKQLAELKERQQDLFDAKEEGKIDKIKKRILKLKETEADFKSSQNKLEAFYDALKLEMKNNSNK